MTCPKCGAKNPDGVQFCTNCHATLLFKCPQCEHTQTHGGVCDACGMNLDLFWASYLTMKANEEQKIERDKAVANIGKALTVVEAPFMGGRTISQFFIVQLLGRLFARFARR